MKCIKRDCTFIPQQNGKCHFPFHWPLIAFDLFWKRCCFFTYFGHNAALPCKQHYTPFLRYSTQSKTFQLQYQAPLTLYKKSQPPCNCSIFLTWKYLMVNICILKTRFFLLPLLKITLKKKKKEQNKIYKMLFFSGYCYRQTFCFEFHSK